jgi:hypothetical protein
MKSVHLELDDETYAQLERRAKRLGVDTQAAARTAVCEQLATEPSDEPNDIEAILDELDRITSKLPEVDVVEIIREAREEIEERDRRRWG